MIHRFLPLLLLCSCMSTTERFAKFSDQQNAALQEFAAEQEERRLAHEEAMLERQAEFDARVEDLNEQTNEAIANAATDDEVAELEAEFYAKVELWLDQLRLANAQALANLKDNEVSSVKDLVEDSKTAMTEFKDGLEEDWEKFKENGGAIVSQAGRATAGALGFGPLWDLIAAVAGGAGVGAVGLNAHRNKKRLVRGESV